MKYRFQIAGLLVLLALTAVNAGAQMVASHAPTSASAAATTSVPNPGTSDRIPKGGTLQKRLRRLLAPLKLGSPRRVQYARLRSTNQASQQTFEEIA